ncbi:hypothetical protein LCGC14_2232730 [marine sediment metagenome]|uniref:Uncharacterized protein n=1 Tax=marine sediment metagenome TaxID=412755 RepID=A0A0F9DVD8_9ZZZZ
MGKETAIKVSKEFKEFLVDKKKEGEDFEKTLKRLVNQLKANSEPVNHKKDKQLTSEPHEKLVTKDKLSAQTTNEKKNDLNTKEGRDAERKRLDEEYKNLPKFIGGIDMKDGKVPTRDELPDEIGGVKIK